MTPTLRGAGRLSTRTLPSGVTLELVEKSLDVAGYDPGTRTVTITASDETVDRYGDVVRASGWDLTAYRRNPVVLVDHSYQVDAIVGTAEVAVRDGRLVAGITLDPPETNRRASIVANLLAAGSLRAVSVGFRPLEDGVVPILDAAGKWTGGFEFKAHELLEISWVAVPANPSATLSSNEAGATGDFLSALRETVQGLTR